jgi:hypothetical protein
MLIVFACINSCTNGAASRLKYARFTLFVLVLLATPRLERAAETGRTRQSPIIVFMTDYGTFDDAVAVCIGRPLLFIDSSGLLSVAINQESFAKVHDVTPPVEIFVARRKDR